MRTHLGAIALCVLSAVGTAKADVIYTVDPGAAWQGYMNVFELPANGGAYLWGSGWEVGDLPATFAGPVLTLAPNSIDDPSSYWYTPSGQSGAAGNKIMDANLYQEFTGTLAGQTVTFTGEVLANTFTTAHTAIAFVKDFAPDYSSFVSSTVPLTAGTFSVSLSTINDPARHVQFGFTTNGPDVWITDVAPYGSIQVTAVPEPSALLVVLAGTALLGVRSRRA